MQTKTFRKRICIIIKWQIKEKLKTYNIYLKTYKLYKTFLPMKPLKMNYFVVFNMFYWYLLRDEVLT